MIDVLRVKSEEMKKDPSCPFMQGEVEAKESCMTSSNNDNKPSACGQSGENSVKQRTIISPLRTSKPFFQDEFKNLGLNAISLFEEEISSAGDKDLLNRTEVSDENSLHTADVQSEDSFNTADVRSKGSLNTVDLEGEDSMNKDNINGEQSLNIANIKGDDSLNTTDVKADDVSGKYSLNAAFLKIGGCLNTSDEKGGECFITTDVGDDDPLNNTDVKGEQSLSPNYMKDDARGNSSLNTTQYDNIELEEKSFRETHDGTNEGAGDIYLPGSITNMLEINPCTEGFKDVHEKTPRAPSSLGTWMNDENDLIRKALELNDQTVEKDNSFRKQKRTACDEQPYCDLTRKCESACGVLTTTDQMDTFHLNVDVEAGRSENNISTDSEEELEEFLLKPVSQRKSPVR